MIRMADPMIRTRIANKAKVKKQNIMQSIL
jgi:hypothetical protein